MLNEHFFLTTELIDIIKFNRRKAYENESFLTDLYTKKHYSLRRISNELGCSKSTVRKKLFEAGVRDFSGYKDELTVLKKKIASLRKRGLSYERIAWRLNLWGVKTRSGEGRWYGKTAREMLF